MPKLAERIGWPAVVGLSAFALALCGTFFWASLVRDSEKPGPQRVRLSARQARQDPFSGPRIRQVQARQRARFKLFRTPPEPLPEGIVHVMQRPSYGSNWLLSQRFKTTIPGRYWLIPGNRFLCLLVAREREITQTCAPTRIALARGLAAVSLKRLSGRSTSGNRVIIGVAPDGVSGALVHTGRTVVMRHVSQVGAFTLRDSESVPPDSLTLK
jgi:hypothetical protein